jgi:hypothetical protein
MFFLLLIFSLQNLSAKTESIIPAGDWRDTKGDLIAATEGGFIKVGDLFYLWGMDRSANNYNFVGVNLYSSPDLKNWTFVNKILKNTSHADLNNGATIERAKILHNTRTGQFVMWMHFEGKNPYKIAEVAYATCNTIGGNYTFQSHFRPMDLDSRDINVYQDDNGKGYLICTTLGNQNVSLFELDSTYTKVVKEVYRGSASTDMECEGHAIIKSGGNYFWLMSWCTGWDFNDNHYFYAPSLAGPWKSGGNIAVVPTHTYESQVGFALTIQGTQTTSFLYTGDRWSVSNYGMSRVVFLPLQVSGTTLKLPWADEWDINTKTGECFIGAKSFIDGIYSITAKHTGMVLGTNGSAIQQQTTTGAENQLWRIQNVGASHFKITSVASGKSIDISDESRVAGAKALQYEWKDSYNQKFHIIDCGNGYHRLVSVNTLGKALEIENNSKSSGADAVIGDFSYKDNQLWQIKAVNKDILPGKSYMFINGASSKALDESDKAGDSLVTQSKPMKYAQQVWRLKDLYNGFYLIINVGSGDALDNLNSVKNGSVIGHKTPDTLHAQQWQISLVKTDYYKIVNRVSGKVLDNKDNSLNDGTAMIQLTDQSSTNTNQLWKLEVTDVVAVKQNPFNTSGELTHSTIAKNFEYTLFNLRGRKITSSTATSLVQFKHNCRLPAGTYLLIQKSGNHKTSQQFFMNGK